MQKFLCFILAIFISTLSFSQKTNDPNGNTSDGTDTESDIIIDYIILNGGIGAGAVVSSNIVNSGALVSSQFDILFQMHHHRFGFGLTNEFFITPENLGRLVFGDNANVNKGYLMYEWAIFRRSPINLGFNTQLGAFSRGNESEEFESEESRTFANVGIVLELGAPNFLLCIRPMVEYKSYGEGSFHKEISGVAQVGLRWKLPTEEEKKRLADKKKRRRNR